MSNYSIQQECGTFSGASTIMNRFFVGPLLAAGVAAQNIQSTPHYPAYVINESSRTCGQLANPFTGEYEDTAHVFEGAVTSFYATLLAKQEPLGKEFEDVLDENRWSLYVRS